MNNPLITVRPMNSSMGNRRSRPIRSLLTECPFSNRILDSCKVNKTVKMNNIFSFILYCIYDKNLVGVLSSRKEIIFSKDFPLSSIWIQNEGFSVIVKVLQIFFKTDSCIYGPRITSWNGSINVISDFIRHFRYLSFRIFFGLSQS